MELGASACSGLTIDAIHLIVDHGEFWSGPEATRIKRFFPVRNATVQATHLDKYTAAHVGKFAAQHRVNGLGHRHAQALMLSDDPISVGINGIDDWFPKPLNAPRLVTHIRNRVANSCA